MSNRKISETQLFDGLKQWLRDRDFTVYGEVTAAGDQNEGRVDLLACKANRWLAFETKTTLSLKVIEQAYNWKHKVNETYIVIPKRTLQQAYRMANTDNFIAALGVGLIEVDPTGNSILSANGIETRWSVTPTVDHEIPLETRKYDRLSTESPLRFCGAEAEVNSREFTASTLLHTAIEKSVSQISTQDLLAYAKWCQSDRANRGLQGSLSYDSLWNWWTYATVQYPDSYVVFDRVSAVRLSIFSQPQAIGKLQQQYWQTHVCSGMQRTQGVHVSANANYITPWKAMVQLLYQHMVDKHDWYTKQMLAEWLSSVPHPNIWTNLEAGIGNALASNPTIFATKLQSRRRYYRARLGITDLWS